MSRLSKYVDTSDEELTFLCAGNVEEKLKIDMSKEFNKACQRGEIGCDNCAFEVTVLNQVIEVVDESVEGP